MPLSWGNRPPLVEHFIPNLLILTFPPRQVRPRSRPAAAIKQVLEVNVPGSRKLIASKPTEFPDFRRIGHLCLGVARFTAHPNSQVMLTGVSQDVVCDRDEFDVRDGDADLLERE
jgi:hypothetical protein